MSTYRRTIAAEIALVVLMALAVLVSTSGTGTNPVSLTSGLAVATNAESTSLYCTGFTGSDGVAPASVIFWNTAAVARDVVATISSTRGRANTQSFRIDARSAYTLGAVNFPGRHFFGVSAAVAGGGVTGIVSGVGDDSANVPCSATGVTSWTATGLSTKVNTTLDVTLLNPTATVAEVNISALSTTGFSAPQSFQGIVIASHGVAVINIGSEIVNDTDVMVHVAVVQGSVVGAAAISWMGRYTGATIVAGSTAPVKSATYPDAPTNNEAVSQLAFANPNDVPVQVSVQISYSHATNKNDPHAEVIYPFQVTIGALSVSELPISPTTRVPAGGARSLVVSATNPVVTTLLTKSSIQGGGWWTSPANPVDTQLMLVNSVSGFGSLAVVNPSTQTASITLTYFGRGTTRPLQFSLAAKQTVFVHQPGHVHDGVYTSVLCTSSVAVAVAGSRAGQPNGVRVVNSSGGW